MNDNAANLQQARMKATQNSRLLKLPAELRNRVYHFVLVSPDPVVVVDADVWIGNRRQLSRPTIYVPSLLQTCHTIRSEATELYSSSNAFTCRASDRHTLVRWIEGRTSAEKTLLKNLRPVSVSQVDYPQFFLLSVLLADAVGFRKKITPPGISADVIRMHVPTSGEPEVLTPAEIISRMSEKQKEHFKCFREYEWCKNELGDSQD